MTPPKDDRVQPSLKLDFMLLLKKISVPERWAHAVVLALSLGASGLLLGVETARIRSTFLFERVVPRLESWVGDWNDLKTRLLGRRHPKSKIVIVEIDNDSLAQPELGRWPWSRVKTAGLFANILDYRPKVLGLDVIFSEKNPEVPEEIQNWLQKTNRSDLIKRYDLDAELSDYVRNWRDRIVLGWMTEQPCVPYFDKSCSEGVLDESILREIPKNFDRFSVPFESEAENFDARATPIRSAHYTIQDIPRVLAAARYNASIDSIYDSDGLVRRTPLLTLWGGNPYASIALRMAAVGLGQPLGLKIDKGNRVQDLKLGSTHLPVTTGGYGLISYAGPSYSFDYVSAKELFFPEKTIHVGTKPYSSERELKSRSDVFQDAYVLVGISALAVGDLRATPFDPNTPGVEIHANILENLLQGTLLHSPAESTTFAALSFVVFILLALGQLVVQARLSSSRNVLFLLGWMLFWAIVDLILYHLGWASYGAFFLLQSFAIGLVHATFQYAQEEKQRKLIKSAFSHYLSPSMVDTLSQRPGLLKLGVERKDLTMLFADVRDFTTSAEKMSYDTLAKFISEFHSLVSDAIFRHGGTIDKYIGDAVMAFWGAPLPVEDHAVRAMRALSDIARTIHNAKAHFKETYGIPIEMGAALHTGVVGVGNVGSSTFFNYTAIGDNVNVCSRLEGLTKYYGCRFIVSSETYKHLEVAGIQNEFAFLNVDRVRVKGRQGSVDIYQYSAIPFPETFLKYWIEGKSLYDESKWQESCELLRKAEKAWAAVYGGPGHGPSRRLAERCEEFAKSQPEEGWDRIWVIREK